MKAARKQNSEFLRCLQDMAEEAAVHGDNAVATAAGLTALAGLSHLCTLYLGNGAAANPVVGAVARIRAELFGSVPSLTAIDGTVQSCVPQNGICIVGIGARI